jgi:transcriptional regulator with XRE-family HTH domain
MKKKDNPPKLNRVADVLKEQGRSQRWLADKLGISTNAMHNICSQQSQSLERLFEIAGVLGVSVLELINAEYSPKKSE